MPWDSGIPPGLNEPMRELREALSRLDLFDLDEEAEDADLPPPPAPPPVSPSPAPPRPVRPLEAPPSDEPETRVFRSFSSTSRRVENGVAVTLQHTDGNRTLRIEKDDDLVYEGPLNGDADLERVPEEYRERAREMRDSIRVQMQTPPTPRPALPRGPVI